METDFIKYDLNLMGEMMGKMDHDHNPPMEYLRREAAGLRQGMFKISSLDQWSEDMDSSITPVFSFLEERMSNPEVLSDDGLIDQMGGNEEINILKKG